MKKLPTILLRIFFLSIIVFLLFGWWISDRARFYQNELSPQLREEYGFTLGTPYIQSGNQSIEVLAIYPDSAGAMKDAGFREGDIILSTTLTRFYKQLSESEGNFTVKVTHGGDGEPINERDIRVIKINIPD